MHAYTERGVTTSTIARIYHYEDPAFPTLLTGITVTGSGSDGKLMNQRMVTWRYDHNGKAILSVKGEPKQTGKDGRTIAGTGIEQVMLDRSEPGQTVLTNSLGQTTTYRHAIIGGEFRLLEVRGAGCASCGDVNMRYGYDKLGRLTETTQLNEQGQPIQGTKLELDYFGRTIKVSRVAYQNGKPSVPQMMMRYEYAAYKDNELPSYQPTLIARPSAVPGKEHQIRITYNEAQQPIKVTESGWSPAIDGSDRAMPIERTTTYAYSRINGRSLLTQIDGPLPNGKANSPTDSDVTLIRYAAHGSYPTEIVAPGNQISKITERDDAGRPRKIVIPGGIELAYELDPSGHIIKMTKGGISEFLSYNALGQLAGVVQATGQRMHFAYGLDGRLTDIFDAQNNRIRIQRDTVGRLITRNLLNPDGSIAQQTNPAREVIDPEAPNISGQTHDVAEDPEAIFGLRNIAARLVYDQQRRLSEFTDPRNLRTGYRHDDFGRLVRVDSPDAGTTVFRWNAADQVTDKIIGYGTPQAQILTYRYDAAGRVIGQTAPEGKTTIVYGQHGRPTDITFPAGEEQYAYDAAARLIGHTRIIDGNRFTTRYVYDERGLLKQKHLPDGQILAYRYNGAVHPKAGMLNAITRKDLFGDTALLQGLNDAEDGYANQRYQLANGLDYIRQLDKTGHVTRIGSPRAWEENHQRDADGQLTQRDLIGPAARRSTGYIYDPLGRLTGIARVGLSTVGSGPAGSHNYSYDPAGNLLTQTIGNRLTRYIVDPRSNRILAAQTDGQLQPYAYNAAGSVTQIGDRTFTWDSQQRLIKVSDAGKPFAEYSYNAFGERIRKVVYAHNQKKVTYFFYDGSHLVAEAEPLEGKAKITRQYVWLEDQGGARPIALLQSKDSKLGKVFGVVSEAAGQATGTDVHAIVADHTGVPRAIVNAQGRTIWQAEVTGYGHTILAAGNQLELNLRGSNQYHDEETGLHYNTRRYLDPHSGRYLSADPSGQAGGINLYVFAYNNPLQNIDPLGLQAKPVSGMSFSEKLAQVFELAIPKVPDDVGQVLKELVSPANIASTVAIFAVWGALQLTPIGWIADGALMAFAYYEFGRAGVALIQGLIGLIAQVNDANCAADLDAAAQTVSKTFAAISVNVAAGALLKNVVQQTKSIAGTTAPPQSGKKLQIADPKQVGKKAVVVESVGFKPQGLKKDPKEFPDGVKLVTELKKKGLSTKDAEKTAADFIETGSTLPAAMPIDKVNILYKFVPKGKVPGAQSEYWVTEAEMTALKANPVSIADKLGLPSWSTAANYDIYAIKPNNGAVVFQSRVAITKEVMSDGSVVIRSGGATQTLVPDRSLFTPAVKVGSI